MELTYNFPAIRGVQAGRQYFLAMCPLKLVPKLFLYDEEGVPAELRAQRVLNKARIPEIANYIIENTKEYVFSALTVSVDTQVKFEPVKEEQVSTHRQLSINIGTLSIPMDATIVINDGQHRRAAIEEALKLRPELADESIAIVFFMDEGLRRSQQMFADLNKHAVRPSQSLGVLYEHREQLSELARQLTLNVDVFKNLTEKEKTSISNRSAKLFTLSSIYQATQELLRKKNGDPINESEKRLAIEFWNEVTNNIPEWSQASRKEVHPSELRENYIHAHGVALQAIGIAGAELVAQYPDDWKERLHLFKNIDWSRNNTTVWEGRAMLQARINKAQRQVILTANYLKMILGLTLQSDEQILEDTFMINTGKPHGTY